MYSFHHKLSNTYGCLPDNGLTFEHFEEHEQHGSVMYAAFDRSDSIRYSATRAQ